MRLTFALILTLALPLSMGCEGEIGSAAGRTGTENAVTGTTGGLPAGTGGSSTGALTDPPSGTSTMPPTDTPTTGQPPVMPDPPPTTSPPATPPPPVTPPPAPAAATIVPLYGFPTNPAWDAIVKGKQAHPRVTVVAVVNPSNGPGTEKSDSFVAGIDKLLAAGIVVAGYVTTDYAARSAATVQADIDRWKTFYPKVTWMFFDEQSAKPGYEPYYKGLSDYAKSKGFVHTIGNPGADTAESYIGALDTMLIYESKGCSLDALQGWHTKHAPGNFGVIPYGTALDLAYVKTARERVGYIYLTSDDMPNPWDTLSPYFNELLAALE